MLGLLVSSKKPNERRLRGIQMSLGELSIPCFDFAFAADVTVPWRDIFTDGSCLRPDQPECSLAAWACVSASQGR